MQFQPFTGNPYTYGRGPGHTFFLPEPSPLDNPRTLSLPAASPFDNVTEGALATLASPEGDAGGQPSESIAHPNPTVAGMLSSLATGLALANPAGMMFAGPVLATRDYLGMEPGFTRGGLLADLAAMGMGYLTSEDRTAGGLANAPPGTGAMVGQGGLWGGLEEGGSKGGLDDGGSKGGVDVGTDAPGPSSSPDKGEPGEGGEKGDYRTGGLVQLAGGGKIAVGLGGGLDDLIPTTIDGRRAAALSDGEFVVPADVVSMMGDGSSREGSQRLYNLMRTIREHKTGSGTQKGPLPVGDVLRRIFG